MLQFLFGVAFGAAGYWAWNSFGRDLLGMGDPGDTSYGGFSSGNSTSFSTPSTPSSMSSTSPSSTSSSSETSSAS